MITEIFIYREAAEYLKKHKLIPQFEKAVLKFKSNSLSGLDFKKRKPKSQGIWSFRITKKYRALATRTGNTLKVYRISDHQ